MHYRELTLLPETTTAGTPQGIASTGTKRAHRGRGQWRRRPRRHPTQFCARKSAQYPAEATQAFFVIVVAAARTGLALNGAADYCGACSPKPFQVRWAVNRWRPDRAQTWRVGRHLVRLSGRTSCPTRNNDTSILCAAGHARRWPTGPAHVPFRGGVFDLLGWAFRPRNFMKNWHHGKGGSGEVGLTVKKSRS